MNRTTVQRYGRVWLMIALGLALVGVANWHLVSVAGTSAPDCVTHRRLGDDDAAGRYSAAQSSCSPAANRLEAR